MAHPHAQLSRRYRFSASHRLHIGHLPDAANLELYGKCNNPHGHGHNYVLQITVAGSIDPETGMVVNLGELDAFVQAELLERFDLSNLNHDAAFATCVPSTENLATLMWQLITPFTVERSPLRLLRVRLEETYNNAFDYFGETSALDGQPRLREQKISREAA